MANVEALNELPAHRGGINLQQSSSNHFASRPPTRMPDEFLAGFPLARGAVAQLGERLICIQEVVGSIPISSTITK
jgi:hypothetical protein